MLDSWVTAWLDVIDMVLNAAGASTMLATSARPIITAQNKPNVEKKPMEDCMITKKPAMSDRALPTSASPEAPPTAFIEAEGFDDCSISPLNLSMT